MKVVILIKALGLGGAERHAIDLARALAVRKHDVTVVYSMLTDPSLRGELDTAGVPVQRLKSTNPIGQFGELRKFLRAIGPTIVHAHSPALKLFARTLKPYLGFRLVTTHHNVFHRHRWLIRALERIMHRCDDAQISCSGEVAASMPWETVTVPNGINLDQAPRHGTQTTLRERFEIPEDVTVFVCVAVLLEKKNHQGLIAAFSKAFPQGDGARLVLFGDGPLRDSLEGQASANGVGDAVIFAGADPDARHLVGSADIFCLVSQFEGLPLALLEAMAQGLPCVVSRAGEMPKVVTDGQTGLVVDADDTDGTATALQTLAGDAVMQKRMGNAGQARVQAQFGLDPMVDRIEKVYAFH